MSDFNLKKDIRLYRSLEYEQLTQEISNHIKYKNEKFSLLNSFKLILRTSKQKHEKVSKEDLFYLFPVRIKIDKNSDVHGKDVWVINVSPLNIKSEKLHQKLNKHFTNTSALNVLCENKELHSISINQLIKPDGITTSVKVPNKIIDDLVEGMKPKTRMNNLFFNEDSNLSRLIGKNLKNNLGNFYYSKNDIRVAIYTLYGINLDKNISEVNLKALVEDLIITDFGISLVEDANTFIEKVEYLISLIRLAHESLVFRNIDQTKSKYEYEKIYLEKAKKIILEIDSIILKNKGQTIHRINLDEFYLNFIRPKSY